MEKRPELIPGKTFGKYTILKLIARGGFCDVYRVAVLKDKQQFIMKLEAIDTSKPTLENEHAIMKLIDGCLYFPRYIQFGHTTTFRFIIEELLGPSLSDIRKSFDSKKIHLSSGLRCGIEMIRCIENFHRRGYVHRDIKPSNFLLKASRSAPLALVDYGLAKCYIDIATQDILPAKAAGTFAGTKKYASLNAHKGRDLGRRDDIISWFYSLLELVGGPLPWAKDANMAKAKEEIDMAKFLKPFPREFEQLWRYLQMLKFEDCPNYALIISFIDSAMKNNGCSWYEPFVWETMDQQILMKLSYIPLLPPLGDVPNVPVNLPPPIVPGEEPIQQKKGCCNIA